MNTELALDDLPDKILLFDGVCNLCNQSVQYIIKREPAANIHFASLQSGTGQRILKAYGLSQVSFSSLVYKEGDQIYTQSGAVLAIVPHLQSWVRFLRFFRFVPRFLRDAVYSFIAKNRYRFFGKQDACMLPTPALKARFLD